MSTSGINHLGLAVLDLDQTTSFFVDVLGWKELGRDPDYPRTIVSDGKAMVTLWQIDRSGGHVAFDRRKNVGLHHVAFQVETEEKLNALAGKLKNAAGVKIEFTPEPLAGGPRKHMMCYEPGGVRIEFIWPGK